MSKGEILELLVGWYRASRCLVEATITIRNPFSMMANVNVAVDGPENEEKIEENTEETGAAEQPAAALET
eukprot:1159720-Amphidinium_carterae.2